MISALPSHRRWLPIATPLLALTLAGCSVLGRPHWQSGPLPQLAGPPPAAFELAGRVSVNVGERAYSGGLAWSRAPEVDLLRLSTPLGQGVAEIRRDSSGVTLRDAEGVTLSAESDEQLLQRVLGLRLPLAGLSYWVSGLPRPQMPYRALLDDAGQVVGLQQDGWSIDYDRHRAVRERSLPGRVFARYGDDLRFRLVIDDWGVP